jgi:hypothetical protein
VKLADLNDHAPVFSSASYEVTIAENVALNSRVVAPLAVEEFDAGNNALISYSLTSGNTSCFRLNDIYSGQITTNCRFDYESIKSYVLTITASDQGTPTMSTNANLTVMIGDINDNKPFFNTTTRFTFTFFENVTAPQFFGTITAMDLDGTSPNNKLSYDLVNQDSDDISPLWFVQSTGLVALFYGLDFEVLRVHNFLFYATDGGSPSLSTSVGIRIVVLDVNDNAPVFDQSDYFAEIPADLTSGSIVAEPSATDADGTSPNNDIRFSLIAVSPSTNTKFSINSITGRITNNNRFFLATETSTYILNIRATDRGSPARFSDVPLVINITAVNDNAPVFSKSTYTAQLSEDASIGVLVATVAATDAVRLLPFVSFDFYSP